MKTDLFATGNRLFREKKWGHRVVLTAILGYSALSVGYGLSPAGVCIQTFPATGASPVTQYISVPLPAQASYVGPVTAVGSNTLAFPNTPFVSGNLTTASAPYFAFIMSGTQAGRMMRITANTSSVLTLDTTDNSVTNVPLNLAGFSITPQSSIYVGDTVGIFPADTLANFFGNSSASLAVVTGGATSGAADLIYIFNKSTGAFDTFFFNTTTSQWNRVGAGTVNMNNVILYPEGAIGILRRAGRVAAILDAAGDVPQVHPLTKVTGGNTSIVTSLRYPVDLTLGSLTPPALNLSGITPGGSLTTGDNLCVYNLSTNKWDSYFLNGATWNDKLGANANSVAIPSGTAVSFFKRNGRPSPGLGSYIYTAIMPY